MPDTDERLHLAYLDGLRAVAALAVLVCHTIPVAWPLHMPHTRAYDLLKDVLATVAQDAVCLFIVLSGFCLMLPVARSGFQLKGGVKTFFYKRAKRILPPYYCALLVCWLMFGVLFTQKLGGTFDRHFPLTKLGVLSHLTLTNNWFLNYEFNTAYWTIAVEWQIYFLFPLLVLGWRKVGPWLMLAMTLTVCLFLMLKRLWFPWQAVRTAIIGIHPMFLFLFAVGMLGAVLITLPAWQPFRRRAPWSLFALTGLALAYGYSYRAGFSFHIVNGIERQLFFAVFALGLLVAAAQGGLNKLFSWKPLAAIGIFGYSLYLMHSPAVEATTLFSRNFLSGWTAALFIYLAIPLALAVAYGFHLVAERPFMNTKPREAGVNRE